MTAMRSAWVMLVLIAVGCASREPRPVNFAVAPAPPGDKNAVMNAVETALSREGYAIAKRDNAGGVIVTYPISLDRDGQRTWREDNPIRKVAEVRVAGSGESLKVHCKVVIQEQAAESYRLLAYERGGDDVPGHHTAIDRDAATTAEQNAVWKTVRRDRPSERQILSHLAATP